MSIIMEQKERLIESKSGFYEQKSIIESKSGFYEQKSIIESKSGFYEQKSIAETITETSAGHWDFVIQENLTAKEAVQFMKSGIRLRTFEDNLRAFYPGDDLKKRLTEGLCRYTKKDAESVRRKVNNWMQNRNLPSGREELFCICFLLGLDETASDHLLKRLAGQGIHYRNTRELVYAYCLKYGLGYDRAQQLAEEILPQDQNHCPGSGREQKEPLTGMVRENFQALRENKDLLQFILDHKSVFGTYHNTAYQYYTAMLAILTEAGGTSCSLEDAADTYLRLNMPVDRHTAGYSIIQKLVKRHWPGSRSIKAMKERTQDVTRKALLLLYLVTGGAYQDSYEELDEEYVTAEEFLEYHCREMNRMLSECGMARMDPRNAFDFLVLYAIRPEGEAFMSDRMAEAVRELYQNCGYTDSK